MEPNTDVRLGLVMYGGVSLAVYINGVAQEFVALFRTVAAERFAPGHLIDRLVHGLDGRGRQRLGHVANAAADQPFCGVGVLLAKDPDAPSDFGE